MADENLETTDDSAADPDAPGSAEETSPTDAEAGSEGAAEADGEGEQGEGEGTGTAEAQPGAYEKLLAKYGGDKDKMAQAVWDSYNSTAQLYDKLQNIEKYIVGQQTPQVDENQLIQQDPQVQRLMRQFNGVKGRLDSIEAGQTTLISEYGKVVNEIQYLKGALSKADVDAKAELQQDLREATRKQEQLQERLSTSRERAEELRERLNEIADQGKAAEADVRTRAQQQRQQAEAEIAARQTVRGEFADAMTKEAERYGVTPDSKQFKLLFRSVNNDIVSFLSKLPDGSPAIDIPEAVEHFMAEYADAMGLKAKFQKASTLKRSITTSSPKAGTAPTRIEPKPPKDGRWTRAFVEDRARRMLGD